MMAEGRLLRLALAGSVALHLVAIGFLACTRVARPVPVEELRVVTVGTYTPPAPRPEARLPRQPERRSPAPARPARPRPVRIPAPPRPVAQAPRPRAIPVRPARPVAVARRPAAPARPALPPVAPSVRPAPTVRPVVPQRTRAIAPRAAPRPSVPARVTRAVPRPAPLPQMARAVPVRGGGRLSLGSASPGGRIPVGGGGRSPAGQVPNEQIGGTGTGSGDRPNGRGSSEPTGHGTRAVEPEPPGPVAPRPPEPPPPVSARVCRRSALLAGRHCAEFGGPVAERSFPPGQEPGRRCGECKPPPAPEPEHANRSVEAREPVLLREAEPDYPEHLQEAGVQGTVTVSYTVDERGRITGVSVARSSGSAELDACAVRAIKRFRYKPAEQGGQPRPFRLTKPFAFRLRG